MQPGREVVLGDAIARGTHSVVYFARDVHSMEPLAIKIVPAASAGGRHLYRTEGRVLRALTAAARGLDGAARLFPRLHGTSWDAERREGRLVLEYMPFPTLAALVDAGGALAVPEAVFVVQQLVRAVAALEQLEWVHRDIKTENIMVHPDTLHVKLIDFGLATSLRRHAHACQAVGTPLYMAPEAIACRLWPDQFRPYALVPADLWSVGVVFWELLAGRQPFEACREESVLARAQLTIAARAHAVFDAHSDADMVAAAGALALLKGLLKVRVCDRLTLEQARVLLACLCPRPLSPRYTRAVVAAPSRVRELISKSATSPRAAPLDEDTLLVPPRLLTPRSTRDSVCA